MFQWIITFIFTSFVVIINEAESVTLTEEFFHYGEKPEEYLAPISPREMLPIVLFEVALNRSGTITQLQMPDGIIKAETLDRKMVKGTQFSNKNPGKQIFFCIDQEEHVNCLSPQHFEDWEQLMCSINPMPESNTEKECGIGKSGFLYNYFYRICKNKRFYSGDEYNYPATPISLFKLCYDTKERRALYAIHKIESAKLLVSPLLHQEHSLDYSFVNEVLGSGSYTSTNSNESYKPQKLIPLEDMAFANLRKAVYPNYNSALQHVKLLQLWNAINQKIREKAIQISDDNVGCKLEIRTGVFNIYTNYSIAGKGIYDTWVKMILCTLTTKGKWQSFGGVAILMNNILITDGTGNQLETYCPSNCKNDFINEFSVEEGQVLCCQITHEIQKLFDLDPGNVNLSSIPVLEIPGLIEIEPQVL